MNAATSLKPVRQLLDATLKIDHHRSLPKYSTAPSAAGKSVARQTVRGMPTVSRSSMAATNCYNHPQLGKDLLKVLNAMGTAVTEQGEMLRRAADRQRVYR